MAGFIFEKNLPHQQQAINSALAIFNHANLTEKEDLILSTVSNPKINFSKKLASNLDFIQSENAISNKYRNLESNIFDISMETGTGKTYTYTKLIFELHKNFHLNKFIIIVPTLSIKAGTMNFLTAEETREHFQEDYQANIKTYLVESQKAKKDLFPQAIKDFVEAVNSLQNIHVLIINGGMINSETMNISFDKTLFDQYSIPFENISAINPVTIIDEPHRFNKTNQTWKNIEKFNSQIIFRFGATFNEQYENLIYNLTSLDAFNGDLVKGVITHIEELNINDKASISLINTDGKEAHFELNSNDKKTRFKLIKNESLSIIHEQIANLYVENLNKSIIVLSNGLELKKGDRINPYSYSQTVRDKMMENAIKNHFELERIYLTRDIKIKPITLFFIDDIEGYRNGNNIDGALKTKFENLTKSYIEQTLKIATDEFYKNYLEKSLADLSLIHGGYFSKDNSETDDKIEREINEILHDKNSLLNINNTRRFIFSKWTLREGWDNPNVFQICKLRSSGSTTSKLQEVGRGLRLPVNEFMARVKNEQFYLNYFVDFTEKDFAESLINEINSKSTSLIDNNKKLNDEVINLICNKYNISEDNLLAKLDQENIIKRNNDFKENGFEKLKELFPQVFSNGLKNNKIKNYNDKNSNRAKIREGKYQELRELWEHINQKVILEYKIQNEDIFEDLFDIYLKENIDKFKSETISTIKQKLSFDKNHAYNQEIINFDDQFLSVQTMSYRDFLIKLTDEIKISSKTLNNVFINISKSQDINSYLNIITVRTIKDGFNKFLLDNAIDKFSINYEQVNNSIHPTKLTDKSGNISQEINIFDLGQNYAPNEKVGNNYLFEDLYFDSDLEKKNIKQNIDEIIVFTKIPKNSIKIPVSGGFSYSPDFAYNQEIINMVKKI